MNNTYEQNQENMNAARKSALINMKECATELVEWYDTGILRKEGRVREIARMLSGIPEDQRLDCAKTIIEKEILKRVVDMVP